MTATTTSPSTRRRPIGWIALTAMLAVLVVALAGVVVALHVADEPPGESADSAARTSCELVTQVPEEGFVTVTDDDELSPHVSRVHAAYMLALLASDLDADYDELSKATERTSVVLRQGLVADNKDFTDALHAAGSACAEYVD